MSPYEESTLAVAAKHLDSLIAMLEDNASRSECDRNPAVLGDVFREALVVRGALAAAAQLGRLEEEFGRADTEPSGLRMVVR